MSDSTTSYRGVSPESQVLIFDRFRQAERADSGTGSGLGLAICKEIVEEHYGTIGVESANGQGSTFWFALTLETGTLRPGRPAPSHAALQDVRVLVVDDNKTNRVILEQNLRVWGARSASFDPPRS